MPLQSISPKPVPVQSRPDRSEMDSMRAKLTIIIDDLEHVKLTLKCIEKRAFMLSDDLSEAGVG